MAINLDDPAKRNFKDKIFHAFSWSFIGYAFGASMRFAGNLILTRLFIPADFGIMQLISVFIQGVAMFSDMGIQVNIVQHKNGEDASFLRTAWTIQIIRGFIIEFLLICLAYPLARIYDIDILLWLIPLAGLNAIIEGFTSTNLVILNRNMLMRELTLLEVISQFIGIVVMIIFAWYFRSIWTLLISGFVSLSIKTLYSHFFLNGPKMKFQLNKSEFHEIFHFGKWIFISSLAGFIIGRMDRLLLGLYISISNLGLYGIAYALAMLVYDLFQTVSSKVLTPLFSNYWRNARAELRHQTFKVRAMLMLLTLILLYPLIIFGEPIVQFLYPPNYWGAGWMLQVLAVACSLKCITTTILPILLATGDSYRLMILQVLIACIFIASLITGGHFFGLKGIIWSIPIAELLNYPIFVWAIRRYGVWLPLLDFAGLIFTIIALLIGMNTNGFQS